MKKADDNLLRDLGLIDSKAPEGAFLMSAVNKFGSVHRQNRTYKKRFSHAPHDRAELKRLREKSLNHNVDSAELLEAHFMWELAQFRQMHIPRHRLLRRWIRRHDPGLNRYLKEIEKTGKYHDIFERSRQEYNRLNKSHYEWPEGCEPFYHRTMPDALAGMRAYGSALLDAEIKKSFDPSPALTADAGGDSGEGSGGSGKTLKPSPVADGDEDNTVAIIPVEDAIDLGLLPPWITRGDDE